ncbi:MAG: ABC transporter, partial [Alphaproteobacteria bacterium]|nr:ABC transporter [Alphaproteobacteria bacterium]
VPALAAALGIYSVVRAQTLLPVNLTALELGGVFAVTLAMAVISALLSVGRLRRADPAEVF